MIEHHTLMHDFPEHHDLIRRLRKEDSGFRNLCDEYKEIDDEIFRIETWVEAASDHDTQEMKLRRVHLKDQIAERLKEESSGRNRTR